MFVQTSADSKVKAQEVIISMEKLRQKTPIEIRVFSC
jgi:hypothetical protein